MSKNGYDEIPLISRVYHFSRDLRTSFVDGPVRVPLHKELNITSTYVVMP